MHAKAPKAFFLFALFCLPFVVKASELDHAVSGVLPLLATAACVVIVIAVIGYYAKAFILSKSGSGTGVFIRALVVLSAYAAIGFGVYYMLR
jgi:small-conductance mechanosensitive channel